MHPTINSDDSEDVIELINESRLMRNRMAKMQRKRQSAVNEAHKLIVDLSGEARYEFFYKQTRSPELTAAFNILDALYETLAIK